MKKVNIAKQENVTQVFISYLLKGTRFTRKPNLAIELAKITGKRPIQFIHPDERETYLKAYPELGEKMKKSA